MRAFLVPPPAAPRPAPAPAMPLPLSGTDAASQGPVVGQTASGKFVLAEDRPEPPPASSWKDPVLTLDEPLFLDSGPSPLEAMTFASPPELIRPAPSAPQQDRPRREALEEAPCPPALDAPLIPEGEIALTPETREESVPQRGRLVDRAAVFPGDQQEAAPVSRVPSQFADMPRMELDLDRTPPPLRAGHLGAELEFGRPVPREPIPEGPSLAGPPPIPPHQSLEPIPLLGDPIPEDPPLMAILSPEVMREQAAAHWDPLRPDPEAVRRLRKARKRARKKAEGTLIKGVPDWVVFLIAFGVAWLLLSTLGLFARAFAWIQLVGGLIVALAAWGAAGNELDRDPRGSVKSLIAIGAGVLMVLTGALLTQW